MIGKNNQAVIDQNQKCLNMIYNDFNAMHFQSAKVNYYVGSNLLLNDKPISFFIDIKRGRVELNDIDTCKFYTGFNVEYQLFEYDHKKCLTIKGVDSKLKPIEECMIKIYFN